MTAISPTDLSDAEWGAWRRISLPNYHAAERRRVGKKPQPSGAIMDAQSVKTVEESASISDDDGHKRVKGRKRHLLVDTLGLPLSISVTSAGVLVQGVRRLGRGDRRARPRGAGLRDAAMAVVMERSLAWLVRNRRLRIDYERKVQTSETMTEVAMIRLLLRRPARGT